MAVMQEMCILHLEFMDKYDEDKDYVYARCPKCKEGLWTMIIDKRLQKQL